MIRIRHYIEELSKKDQNRLDQIDKLIANGNNDPKLHNERLKLLGLDKATGKIGNGKHLAGWKVKKESFDKFITYNNINVMNDIAITIQDYFWDNDDDIEDHMDNNLVYGIRGDDILLTTSDKFYNSYVWIGDIKTDEQLDGVCAVLLDRSDYIKSIRKAMSYGQHLYLLAGKAIEMGTDIYNDEVVLADHKILKVLL